MLGKIRVEYEWRKIEDLYFSDTLKSEIEIIDINEKKDRINSKYTNWIQFLNNIPSKFDKIDRKYISKLINELKYCEICGYKAVHKYCEVCKSEPWQDSFLDEYENKESYIKEEQKDYYAVINKFEKVDFEQNKELGFKKLSDYQLIVSKEEIYKHSIEYFFD